MTLEEFKKDRPDLVEFYNSLDKDELILQCFKEALDAVMMEDRVSVFMETCTNNMSKTNYTPSSIRSMVNLKKEQDIIDFCDNLIEDSDNDQEIADHIWERSSNKG